MAQPQQVQQSWPLLASQHFTWDPYSSYSAATSALDRAVFDRNDYTVLSPTTMTMPQQLFATSAELQTELPTAHLQSIPGITQMMTETTNSLAASVTERMLQSDNRSNNAPRQVVFEEKCVEKKAPRK